MFGTLTRNSETRRAIVKLVFKKLYLHVSFRKAIKEQRKMDKVLKDMFDQTSFFNADELTSVLLVSL